MLWCCNMSRLESMVFLWPRRVFGGSCKTFPFRRCQVSKSCSFAWQAWRFLTFLCVTFCVASALLLRCFQKLIVHFSWQAQHFCVAGAALSTWRVGVFCQSQCQGCVKWWQRANCTVDVECSDVRWHCTLHALHSTLHTLHFTLCTLHSTLYTPHSTLHKLHSTLYTLHSTLHTLHSTLYTPHSTLWNSTLHCTHYTLHFTLHTHSTL